jgi:hypothetical protein
LPLTRPICHIARLYRRRSRQRPQICRRRAHIRPRDGIVSAQVVQLGGGVGIGGGPRVGVGLDGGAGVGVGVGVIAGGGIEVSVGSGGVVRVVGGGVDGGGDSAGIEVVDSDSAEVGIVASSRLEVEVVDSDSADVEIVASSRLEVEVVESDSDSDSDSAEVGIASSSAEVGVVGVEFGGGGGFRAQRTGTRIGARTDG